MSTITMNAEQRQAQEFKGYEEGEYIAQIQGLSSGTSSTGKDYWEVIFRGEGFGRISLRMYDTAFGRQDLYKLYVAVGIDPSRNDVDTEELEDKYVTIKIEEGEPYNDKPTWDVADIFEAGSTEADADDDEDDWED